VSVLPETPAEAPVAPAATQAVRPFYWSVRRELWENRSVLLVPAAIAGLVLFASLWNLLGLPAKVRSLATPELEAAMVRPFAMAPAPIMLAAFLVGFFYAIDALYGERRDRSLLFWKSLPLSDRESVLAKASVPLVVLPLYALLLSLACLAVMLLGGSAILLLSGLGPGSLWRALPIFQQPVVMVYGLAVHVLWWSPIYCWLLLVSAWARRALLLWALLPPIVLLVIEHSAIGRSRLPRLLHYRLTGAMREAFLQAPGHGEGEVLDRIDQLAPLQFLATPGLWTGLAFAALCLFLAVRLRRRREPI
jgi:ABC-2 type transport system permease protein